MLYRIAMSIVHFLTLLQITKITTFLIETKLMRERREGGLYRNKIRNWKSIRVDVAIGPISSRRLSRPRFDGRGFVLPWIFAKSGFYRANGFREPLKNDAATILTPVVIRPRQRQCYSQSRRSREFPCTAHARRFPVFLSCSLRDALRSRDAARRLVRLRPPAAARNGRAERR